MTEEREASVQLLKTFAPLDGMKKDNLAALARKVQHANDAAGRMLFKEGDTDKRTVWLVAGMVELREGERTVAHDPRRHARGAQSALPEAAAQLSPRAPSMPSSTSSIDSDLLDVMITWDQTGTYEVGGAAGAARAAPTATTG